MDTLQFFKRAIFCDDRGYFENIPLEVLEFKGKRAYICRNFDKGMVRAFHYHEYESKIFICLKGAIKFILYPGCKSVEDTHGVDNQCIVINEGTDALFVPCGYANGWQSLTDDVILLTISNQTMEDSKTDDIRFSPNFPEFDHHWKVEWR